MKRLIPMMSLLFVVSACTTTPGEVTDKVLMDFGLRERPEGYVSGTDRVFEQLDEIGQAEMRRLNMEERRGEVFFQEQGAFDGKFYKRAKVYENFFPVDAQASSRGTQEARGYVGYIDYAYRYFESRRFNSRTEAESAQATIRTEETGRETYRYDFGPAGTWLGGKGDRARR